ncbi:major facilitator superfamily domain-containing protein [Plectosphaerella plurivora]|uniref:Major facilitator superfamily domain-containing protein n=1 Tax=Plectosphaerella plurivora TaxID=936078 RepID=A0A9P8VLU5_9PEZI|nr:major facilitator superfamily domain-containing protein [Plectosphaerella plurivora]
MSDPKVTSGTDTGVEKMSVDASHLDEGHQKRSALVAEIGHVAALGFENTAELEKRIVRKLDMWMLPQLWILYMFNYLNRTNIAQARLNTFNEDLNLKDGDYQTAVAILTVGYMLAQLPSNMLITFIRPSVYLPVAAFIWSGVSIATIACTSAGGLWAVQFVLGIVEAPLFPGAVFLMSCWYTRREFALRVALLYSGLVLAQAFSGLIAAGVFAGLDGPGGLAGWQWLFILEGAGSGFFAITAYFILPNYPESKNGGAMWYMTEEMRKVAAARILDDRVEYAEKSTVWVGLKLAVTDLKLYMFLFMNIFITSSYGFNNFFPTIVNGLGFGTRVTALLMTAPPYVLGTICTFFVAWDSDRRSERGLHIIIPLSFSVIGFIVTVSTGNAAVRYAMTFLYAAGCFSANTLQYTWAVSTMGQTPEKRAAGGAIVNIFGHLGNVISPYFFPDRDAPRYTMAMILQIVFASLGIALAAIIKWHLTRKNKKLREEAERLGVEYNPFTT